MIQEINIINPIQYVKISYRNYTKTEAQILKNKLLSKTKPKFSKEENKETYQKYRDYQIEYQKNYRIHQREKYVNSTLKETQRRKDFLSYLRILIDEN